MKNFWMLIGRIYLFFRHKKRAVTPLLLIIVIAAQFILLIVLICKLDNLQNDFSAYKDTALKRQNQIYSQVYILNNRVNQVLEQ